MVFAAYLMENTISGVFPGWSICTLFLSPIVGFFLNARPHRRAFTAFSVENDKCPGGGQARQELDDYVNQKLYFLIYLSFLSITKTSYQHRTEHFLKGLSML